MKHKHKISENSMSQRIKVCEKRSHDTRERRRRRSAPFDSARRPMPLRNATDSAFEVQSTRRQSWAACVNTFGAPRESHMHALLIDRCRVANVLTSDRNSSWQGWTLPITGGVNRKSRAGRATWAVRRHMCRVQSSIWVCT